MKWILGGLAVVGMVLILTGCGTSTVITELEPETGRVVRVTETHESVVKAVTGSLQHKSVIIWENGWAGYISLSAATPEAPTPTGKIFAGKVAKGYISLLPDTDLTAVAEVITATRENLSVTRQGIEATGPNGEDVTQ